MIITEKDMAPLRNITRPDRTDWLRPVMQLPQIRPYAKAFELLTKPVMDAEEALTLQAEAQKDIAMTLAMQLIEGDVDTQNFPDKMMECLNNIDTMRIEAEYLTANLWTSLLAEDVEAVHLDDGHVQKALSHKFEMFPVSTIETIDSVIHLPKWMNVSLSDGTIMDMVWLMELGNGLIQITFMQTPGPLWQNHRVLNFDVPEVTLQKDLESVVVKDNFILNAQTSFYENTQKIRKQDIEAIAPRLNEVCAVIRYCHVLAQTMKMDLGMRGSENSDKAIGHLPQIVDQQQILELQDRNQGAFYRLAKSGWRHVFVLTDD
jgi:hypothetical protein